jgi:Xaa-Pro aminopeptidase
MPAFGGLLDGRSPDLDAFRAQQRLAYQCAEEVAACLTAGVTERDAAARMRAWLEGAGVDDWFHTPFAWFGDRTALRFRTPLEFAPTSRRLEEGMAFILDCAPSRQGVCADIGFTSSLGHNRTVERLLDDLAEHRSLILGLVRQRRTLRDVYDAVEQLAARQGLDCRHHAYPGHVLAHRVVPLRPGGISFVVGGFGTRHLRGLARIARRDRRLGASPLWSGSRRSEHPPTPGLWAVEPHLGFRDVGAKFEELLVVTDDDAFWLDDDLPHVRRSVHQTAVTP